MLQVDDYNYIVMTIRDKIYRVGFIGDKEKAIEYFKTFHDDMGVYARIDFDDTFKLPMTSDLDEVDKRIGNQKHDGFEIKTFSLVSLIMTKSKSENIYDKIKKNHKFVKIAQQRIIDRDKNKRRVKNG